MEFQKIVNFLDTNSDDKDLPRFVTKKLIEVHDQSERNYSVNKNITIKTPMLRSDLCNLVMRILLWKEKLLLQNQIIQKKNKSVAFENNAPFINSVSKISGLQINNKEDLDVVMPMYKLLEYNKNYKEQQAVCEIIINMNQVVLFLLILNLLNSRQELQEKFTIFEKHVQIGE